MLSAFCYFSFIKDYYIVGMSDCGKSMSHNNNCSPYIEFVEILYYTAFVCCVKGISCFVKENEIRTFVYGACYKNALFLSLA